MTIKIRFSFILCLFVCFIASSLFAQTNIKRPPLDPIDAAQIMEVSQIERGMTGYGLTVFQGTKIEKFDFEVLGILRKMNMGGDLILAKFSGGPITEREAGVISGMSGSPCYINGKLIGAVGFGPTFAREPIGMITPISDMLEAWDFNIPSSFAIDYSNIALDKPIEINGNVYNSVSINNFGSEANKESKNILHMKPLMTPLLVSGMTPRGLERLSKELERFGLMPLAGPGSSDNAKDMDITLEPGSAVGVSLATGDIDLTGVGTVTYIRDGRLLAFGHPMLSFGAVDLPMTTAYVEDIISGYVSSYKLATPLKTVGRIFQDRPWSVAGEIDRMPTTIPLTVHIQDNSQKREQTFKMNVINHRLISSTLLGILSSESIYQVHPTPSEVTANVKYEVETERFGKITRENMVYDPIMIDFSAVNELSSLLRILSFNKFEPIDVKSVDLKVTIEKSRKNYNIERIFVKDSVFEPGEDIEVGVVLRPYKQDPVTKYFKINVPSSTPNGRVQLVVQGGNAFLGVSTMPMIFAEDMSDENLPSVVVGSGTSEAENVDQLIKKHLEKEKNNQLVMKLVMRNTTVSVAGEKMTGLPTAISSVMKSSKNSGVRVTRDEVKEVFDEDAIVTGVARLSIEIRKKDSSETRSSSSSSSSSTTIFSDAMDAADTIIRMQGLSSSPFKKMNNIEDIDLDSIISSDDSEKTESSDDLEIDDTDSNESNDGSSEKSESAKEKIEITQSNEETVVRTVTTWSQSKKDEFSKGTFEGTSATSNNKLEIVPKLEKLIETKEQYVWCVLPNENGVYIGTGGFGRIYHISKDGKEKLFFETGEQQVHSMVAGKDGSIYASTSPNGRVFKITKDGKGKVIFDADERFALTLVKDAKDNIYVGMGDSGKIYKISSDDKSKEFAKLAAGQVLCLEIDNNGNLLAGTGIDGVLYRIFSDGSQSVVLDTNEESVVSVISDSKGNIYAGTAPKGAIYKIEPNGRFKTIYSRAQRVMSMACDKNDFIFAVSDGELVRISPDEDVSVTKPSKTGVDFLSLSFDKDSKVLYASTGNVGSLYSAKYEKSEGSYISAVYDTKSISNWGQISWMAIVPDGSNVTLQTRTGDIAQPDSTWSDWSSEYTNPIGEKIKENQARYIQYKVNMKANGSNESPKLSAVNITYLTANSAPTVSITQPSKPVAWSGEQTVKWKGEDPDKNKLTYDLFYAKLGTNDWKPLNNKSESKVEQAKTEKEITEKVESTLKQSKDIPEDMKKEVLNKTKSDVESIISDIIQSTKPTSTTSTSFKWNTKEIEDGIYVIKVTASDKISDALNYLTADALSEPIIICNTVPILKLSAKETTIEKDKELKITGNASTKLVTIAGVQYKIDDGQWYACVPSDGMFDSFSEDFSIAIKDLSAGERKIEIQAIDSAGNATKETVKVTVK
ncbi:MAG: SpoIVB peptidase S55 domain-containing protein [Armatimonadota bacterium]